MLLEILRQGCHQSQLLGLQSQGTLVSGALRAQRGLCHPRCARRGTKRKHFASMAHRSTCRSVWSGRSKSSWRPSDAKSGSIRISGRSWREGRRTLMRDSAASSSHLCLPRGPHSPHPGVIHPSPECPRSPPHAPSCQAPGLHCGPMSSRSHRKGAASRSFSLSLPGSTSRSHPGACRQSQSTVALNREHGRLQILQRCQRVLPDPSALGTLRCMHCSRRRAETSLPRSPPKGCTGRCPLLSLSARSRKACPLPRLHRREWGLWLPAKIPRPSVPRPLRPSRDSVRPGSSIIHRRRLLHRLRNPPVWHPVPCPRASRLLPRRTWGYDRDSRRPRLHRQAQKRRMMTGLKRLRLRDSKNVMRRMHRLHWCSPSFMQNFPPTKRC
mmetsp:Transcript_21797/g.36912  ORF Transcript_21797/g.36912 Transcript_21797/m.36912 type:complete len:383 (+) Transcript_21797:1132-2280(+)